jgi:hypothetical protein
LKQTDPLWELFFEDDALDRRPARNYCNACPVRLLCLREALERPELWGVWGGCDPDELKRALWVDCQGEATTRNRYPNCPACKARPNKLSVGLICDLASRRRRERIECRACGFWWNSSTSAIGVRAYWREQRSKISAQAAAVQRKLPSGRPGRRDRVIYPATPDPTAGLGLVAGGNVVQPRP